MDHEPGYFTYRDFRESVRLLERKLGVLADIQTSCCGVSFAQCHAIVEIGRAGSLSLNALSDLLELDKSTMSRTIQNLVGSGLVNREQDASDRRCVTITLTKEGLSVFGSIEESMNSYFRDVCSRIPGEKLGTVMESLAVLLEALTDTPCCGRLPGERGKTDAGC